jgi:hypothetical protein
MCNLLIAKINAIDRLRKFFLGFFMGGRSAGGDIPGREWFRGLTRGEGVVFSNFYFDLANQSIFRGEDSRGLDGKIRGSSRGRRQGKE